MSRLLLLAPAFIAAAFISALVSQAPALPAESASAYTPTYAADKALNLPENYREWIYLTSGLDMTYTTPASGAQPPSHSIFDNVFVNPESYRTFIATGAWPDKTVFVLENRVAESSASINKAGRTQGTTVQGMEFHVKDGGKWAFYIAGKNGTAKLIPQPASCYTCHEAHAAVDTTFVQFYPTLMPIAQKHKTFSQKYLEEIAAPSPSAAPVTKSN